ncbi:TRAP-type C4-dicarboxylate transport system, small permease component [Roseovarius azorensis]|uniref:TRAP transporter small permease protein n=1 Tax=Roseovarius azorensis TaxID=1287727 RepID=A0A1H7P1F8_9RHOB|nr:TRAP transporter small permease [Roseovarius azorensis]SEL29641.1 TRAP-type C4-dicarboxylate transport system, small permease component [Roseovarius azorensis]
MEGDRNSVVLTALLAITKASIIAISVVMVFVTLAQVVFRYVIAAPLPWSEELARYCFVWIVFLGGAVGLSRGIHLGVDLFVNMLPRKARRGLDALTNALIAGFAATVIYASFPVINMNMFQRSPALGMQMSWIYIAIPVSMALIFLICAERLVAYAFSSNMSED